MAKTLVKEWQVHKEDDPESEVIICALDEAGNPLFQLETGSRQKMKTLLTALTDCLTDAWTGSD